MHGEKLKKYLRWLGTALCLLVLCVDLITLGLNLLGQEQLPYGMLTVESGSMSPAIPKGALVLIRDVPYSELKIGDDVTYLSTDGYVTHRIVGTSGERFITQGIANAMADQLPMGQESYCGKVVLVLPLLGRLIQLLTATPVTAVLTALLVLLVCLIHPVLAQRFDQGVFQKVRGISWTHRAVACAGLLSLLLCVPMTEAKYVAQLQKYQMAVAQPMYFSSNYLSEGAGNTYSIQGWNGKTYELNLTINNSDNALLFNDEQMVLNYGVGIAISDETNQNYEVTLSPASPQPRTSGFLYPTSWDENGVTQRCNDSLPGGERLTKSYSITISPINNYEPQAKDTVKFKVYACTSPAMTYYQELVGTFTLEVAETKDFLGAKTVTNKGSMVELSLTTNLISGEGTDGERLVKIKWDPDQLYLNVYERTAYNAIYRQHCEYDKANGELYMRLQAYSKIELEFFKKTNDEALPDSITVSVVNENSDNSDSSGENS